MAQDDPPGFQRIHASAGSRVFYLHKPSLRKLYNASQVSDYLRDAHITDVDVRDFDFKRKLMHGKETNFESKKQKPTTGSAVFMDDDMDDDETDLPGQGDGQPPGDIPENRFDVRNLMPNGLKVDHLKDLQSAAEMLDELHRSNDDILSEVTLSEMKVNLSMSRTLEEMVKTLGTNEDAIKAMGQVVEERVLEELLTLSAGESRIPLSEWPNNLQKNFFAEVVKLAIRKSPVALSFLLKLVVKDTGSNVEPSHVISIATVFSHLSSLVDKTNNSFQKIQSLQMKMNHMTAKRANRYVDLFLAVTHFLVKFCSNRRLRTFANKCQNVPRI